MYNTTSQSTYLMTNSGTTKWTAQEHSGIITFLQRKEVICRNKLTMEKSFPIAIAISSSNDKNYKRLNRTLTSLTKAGLRISRAQKLIYPTTSFSRTACAKWNMRARAKALQRFYLSASAPHWSALVRWLAGSASKAKGAPRESGWKSFRNKAHARKEAFLGLRCLQDAPI